MVSLFVYICLYACSEAGRCISNFLGLILANVVLEKMWWLDLIMQIENLIFPYEGNYEHLSCLIFALNIGYLHFDP